MPQWVRQAAAIPFHEGRICLVTSSSGRRWVVPKGMIDPGHTSGETALKESWEEAGITGSLHPEPIGSYVYEKYNTLHYVTVYTMNILQIHDNWPERGRRERKFVPPLEALSLIDDEVIREIIERATRMILPGALDELPTI